MFNDLFNTSLPALRNGQGQYLREKRRVQKNLLNKSTAPAILFIYRNILSIKNNDKQYHYQVMQDYIEAKRSCQAFFKKRQLRNKTMNIKLNSARNRFCFEQNRFAAHLMYWTRPALSKNGFCSIAAHNHCSVHKYISE